MLPIVIGRRTQVVKGEVCKTSMQRFESARRLHCWFLVAHGVPTGVNLRLTPCFHHLFRSQ